MKLPNGQKSNVVMWGAAGFLSASLYKLLQIWCDQSTNNVALTPRTEFLVDSDELFNLFVRLQEYRYLNEKSFTKAVEHCDILIGIHIQLLKKEIPPTRNEAILAFMHTKKVHDHLAKLIKAASKHGSSEEEVKIYKHYTRVYELTREHCQAVMRITRDSPHVDVETQQQV